MSAIEFFVDQFEWRYFIMYDMKGTLKHNLHIDNRDKYLIRLIHYQMIVKMQKMQAMLSCFRTLEFLVYIKDKFINVFVDTIISVRM